MSDNLLWNLLLLLLLAISCIIIMILTLHFRIMKLEKLVKNSVIWIKVPGQKFIPTEEPFITENGKQSIDKINERFEGYDKTIVKLQEVGRRTNLRLRSLEEKFCDEELKETGKG